MNKTKQARRVPRIHYFRHRCASGNVVRVRAVITRQVDFEQDANWRRLPTTQDRAEFEEAVEVWSRTLEVVLGELGAELAREGVPA